MSNSSDKSISALEYLNIFPETFLKKVSQVLSFRVPFIQESLMASHKKLLKVTIDFMYAEDKVERWLKLDSETKIPVPQTKDTVQLVETDLDHVIAMLALAQKIFITPKYRGLATSLHEEITLNGIFIHDGGEIGDVGDVTHADEQRWIQTHDEQKVAEHKNLINFWATKVSARELRGKIKKELLQPYFAEEFRLTIEGNFIKFLDRFQATLFGLEHIYPYEEQYKKKKIIEEYLAKYFLEQTYQLMKLLPASAREALRKFILDHLQVEMVEKSYRRAVALGSLSQEEKNTLVQTIQDTFSILYKSDDPGIFVHDWEMLRETRDFSFIKLIENL